LAEIVKNSAIDLIALGEVHENDLLAFQKSLSHDFLIHVGREQSNGLYFDTALLYRGDKFKLISSETQTVNHGRARLKVGELVGLLCLENKSRLNLVISHWNSRLRMPDGSSPRDAFGTAVKKLADDLLDRGQEYFMVVGDFNDEPYSKPMAGSMLATQDRSLALAYKGYLYNPFWRLIGESTYSKLGSAPLGRGGTYFFHEDYSTRWKVFDQMLFSPAFLKPSQFMLDERSIKIEDGGSLLEKMMEKEGRIIDHLPVLCRIDLGAAYE